MKTSKIPLMCMLLLACSAVLADPARYDAMGGIFWRRRFLLGYHPVCRNSGGLIVFCGDCVGYAHMDAKRVATGNQVEYQAFCQPEAYFAVNRSV